LRFWRPGSRHGAPAASIPSTPCAPNREATIAPAPSTLIEKTRDNAERAVTFTLEGVEVPTASIDDLIASKRTGRLQDAADIEVLEEIKRLRS